jgi:hypothetical protein
MHFKIKKAFIFFIKKNKTYAKLILNVGGDFIFIPQPIYLLKKSFGMSHESLDLSEYIKLCMMFFEQIYIHNFKSINIE